MARRVKFYPDVAELQFLAIADRLRAAGKVVAVAQPHHVEGFLRGQHRAMAWAGMVGMAVGDHGALDRPDRIDMESHRFPAQPGGSGHQDALRTHLGYIGWEEPHSSLAPTSLKPAIGSVDARASFPVLRRSGCRPAVRLCARPAAEGRSWRRSGSAAAGHPACTPLFLRPACAW